MGPFPKIYSVFLDSVFLGLVLIEQKSVGKESGDFTSISLIWLYYIPVSDTAFST